MHPFFSKTGIAALREWCRHRPLFALDYDGTLTALANDPCEVSLSTTMQARLRRLRESVPVAVLSGRHRPELETLLNGVAVDFMIGNHGLDWGDPTRPELQRAQGLIKGWLEQLQASPLPATALEGWSRRWRCGRVDLSGVWIEDKQYTLTLHYRNAADPDQAMAAISTALSGLQPAPQISGGKRVFNLFPNAETNKGSALLRLMAEQGFGRAIFFGDDDTDEDVFRLEHPDILGIRVGWHPDSHARFYLRRQQDMSKALAYSLACLRRAA